MFIQMRTRTPQSNDIMSADIKSTHSENVNKVTFQKIKDFLYPEYDWVFLGT